MYHQTCSLCAHRAAAFILLFVLVSQCPYSPYGAPVIRHPHSPQGQSAMNVIEKQVERSSGVNTTNITPFEEIFRHSDAHELRRAPGPPTQAVTHAALNEVAQQKKASSIPRRQQTQIDRVDVNRERLAETHNQHRLRLHHHHQNRLANDPEINFGGSPFHFSGIKYKSTKNARGADRAPRPATEQGFTHSTEHNPARSKDTHGTSISALRYNEIATEGLQTDCTYFTALHHESCTATTCDDGMRAAHARGTPRAPSARPRASAEAPRRNLPPRLTRNCTPHVKPACMSASHHHRKASSGDNDTSEVEGSAGRGGNITKHTMHRRRTLNGITATREHRRDVTPRLQHDHEWRRGTANGAALPTTATVHPRIW